MNLSEFISSTNNTILLDGAMGTQLAEVGLEMGARLMRAGMPHCQLKWEMPAEVLGWGCH
jgi:methionine synthase I (cobalamin-dependent)